MDIVQVLEKTLSQDQNELRQAYECLERFSQNVPDFFKALSQILANAEIGPYIRMSAGLQLKNQLTSKDEVVKQKLEQQWLALPQDVRDVVKNNVLSSLGSETGRPSSSAQCVAYIASIELPKGLWPNLIQQLTDNATLQSVPSVKVANLEAIGYICQEVNPQLLVSESNKILTALVNNIKKDEPSNDIKLAAATALLNSLEFTKANFDTDSERHYIMQVVCEATQDEDSKVSYDFIFTRKTH